MSQTSGSPNFDGRQIHQLTEALYAEFKAAELVWLLSRIGQSFDKTAQSTDYRKNIFYMLSAASQDGWGGQLLAVVLDERPNNKDLQRFAISLGILRLPGTDAGNLEAITNAPDRFQDALVHAALQLERSRWICKIEIPGDVGFGGTGVLVAPDLVLTNQHVIDPPDRVIDLRRVECLFDFRKLEDMITIDPGRPVRLDPNWQPLTRRASRSDGDANAVMAPAADELDYALLRLERQIGNEPVGDPSTASVTRPSRGWLKLYTQPPALKLTDEVIILQHPQTRPGQPQLPLQRASGPVAASGWPQLRVRYTTDTLHGSSGSPCFNQRFDFVALHHCGDPLWQPNGTLPARFNQGIPAAAIVNDLVARTPELGARNVQQFWVVGPPPPPSAGGPVPAPPVAPPAPPQPDAPFDELRHPPADAVVAELRQPAADALVVSVVPLLPLFNRSKLKTNVGQLSVPNNNFKLTRLTGSPGVGKSYSFELIRKAAGELGVISACVNMEGKSLVQACELIVRGMKLDDEEMMAYVLRDNPDDGPLARKFVRWLSKTTQSISGRRWWLMLDSLDKQSVLPAVRELLVNKLLEAKDLDELLSVHLILVGHEGSLDANLDRRTQSESLSGIGRGDIKTLLEEWTKRRGRQLRPAELELMVNDIVGGRNPPFWADDLDAIREKTAQVLEEVLT
jgi:trypsin-like peptidase/effector-associated domain 1 (EAD1)-containing protein